MGTTAAQMQPLCPACPACLPALPAPSARTSTFALGGSTPVNQRATDEWPGGSGGGVCTWGLDKANCSTAARHAQQGATCARPYWQAARSLLTPLLTRVIGLVRDHHPRRPAVRQGAAAGAPGRQAAVGRQVPAAR